MAGHRPATEHVFSCAQQGARPLLADIRSNLDIESALPLMHGPREPSCPAKEAPLRE